MNKTINPIENFIAVEKYNFPPHIVSVQLIIFTPVGTAIAIVVNEKTATETGPRPEANIWWAQTPQPTKPIAAPENTTNGYPNKGLRENTGRTSETIPNAGKTRI